MGFDVMDIFKAPFDAVGSLANDVFHVPLKDVVKAGIGIVTDNPMLCSDLAGDIFGNLCGQHAGGPATTECAPPQGCSSPNGYAQPPGSCGPPPPCDGDDPGATGPVSGGSAGGGSGYLDPNLGAYSHVLHVLQSNFDTLDAATGTPDGKITKDDLKAVLGNPNASHQLKAAAQFLLNHPEYFNQLDRHRVFLGMTDGAIGKDEVAQAIGSLPPGADTAGASQVPPFAPPVDPSSGPIETSGAPGSSFPSFPSDPYGGGAGSPYGGGGYTPTPNTPLGGWVCNASMPPEQKAESMLMSAMGNMDNAMVGLSSRMASLSAQEANATDPNQRAQAQQGMEMLQLQMQQLMQQRSQMFQLISNLSSKFDEMAKAAISNLGKA